MINFNFYVILINYCSSEKSVACIQSLIKAGCCRERIIVVDNASPDNSKEILAQIDGIVLIKASDNDGFSHGNNLGIDYAQEHNADYVILLNNDTEVAEDFLNKIFDNIDQNTVVVPKIYYYYEPNIIWYAGGYIDKKRGRICHIGNGEKDSEKYSIAINVDFACGCCMLIPVSVILRVGKLDESFFMYVEDVDYSIKLKNNGVVIRYNPEAKVWHKVDRKNEIHSDVSVYYGNRNRYFVLKKYHFGALAWIYTILTRTIRYFVAIVTGSNDRLILKAWRDYKKGIMGKIEL